MRALTYTPSIPMILALLRDYDYEDFECIFGHSGILPRDAADVLGFQGGRCDDVRSMVDPLTAVTRSFAPLTCSSVFLVFFSRFFVSFVVSDVRFLVPLSRFLVFILSIHGAP